MLVSANLHGFTCSVQPLKRFSWTDSNSPYVWRFPLLKQQLLNSHTTKNIRKTCFLLQKILINSVSRVTLTTCISRPENSNMVLQRALQRSSPAKLRSKTGNLGWLKGWALYMTLGSCWTNILLSFIWLILQKWY